MLFATFSIIIQTKSILNDIKNKNYDFINFVTDLTVTRVMMIMLHFLVLNIIKYRQKMRHANTIVKYV